MDKLLQAGSISWVTDACILLLKKRMRGCWEWHVINVLRKEEWIELSILFSFDSFFIKEISTFRDIILEGAFF
ncbi:MAG: hypothetical protein AB2L18_02845 [Anaerolineaceae bacterium]